MNSQFSLANCDDSVFQQIGHHLGDDADNAVPVLDKGDWRVLGILG